MRNIEIGPNGPAAALRGLGIGKGDRVGLYLPTCAEGIIVMLACARIGAIHLVVFGLRQDDVWWSTSDIGWVVGHSYIVYAPLLAGCTTVGYEGALDHPDVGTFYRIIEENGVTGVFTSPTAVRLLMKYGSEPARQHDLSWP